ncbi:MAG TPA: amidase family protein, partial [Acidimicrobiales bacterium]
MDFRTESVVDLAAQVRSGARTASELVDHALSAIGARNPTINAFVAVDERRARAAAEAVDAKVAAGEDPGPLAGIPLG